LKTAIESLKGKRKVFAHAVVKAKTERRNRCCIKAQKQVAKN